MTKTWCARFKILIFSAGEFRHQNWQCLQSTNRPVVTYEVISTDPNALWRQRRGWLDFDFIPIQEAPKKHF